jgi:hypothetical protein
MAPQAVVRRQGWSDAADVIIGVVVEGHRDDGSWAPCRDDRGPHTVHLMDGGSPHAPDRGDDRIVLSLAPLLTGPTLREPVVEP